MTAFQEWVNHIISVMGDEANRRNVSPECAFGPSHRRMAQIVIDMDFPSESATGVAQISARLLSQQQ